jgi:hypothetical protein
MKKNLEKEESNVDVVIKHLSGKEVLGRVVTGIYLERIIFSLLQLATVQIFNSFLFIWGLSCPSSVQTSLLKIVLS